MRFIGVFYGARFYTCILCTPQYPCCIVALFVVQQLPAAIPGIQYSARWRRATSGSPGTASRRPSAGLRPPNRKRCCYARAQIVSAYQTALAFRQPAGPLLIEHYCFGPNHLYDTICLICINLEQSSPSDVLGKSL